MIPLWRQRLGTVVSYVGFVLIDSAERLEETGDTMLRWSIEIDPEATTVARLQKFDPDWVVHPGATLLDWREENRLTVEEAALRCGLSRDRYAKIESGEMAYGPDVAGRIAHATGTTAEFWLAREETFREGLAAGKKWSVS